MTASVANVPGVETFAVLVGLLLAVARLTRLVTLDKIMQPARGWVVERCGADSQLAYLVHCPWCMSPWIAAALTPVTWWLTPLGDTGIPAWWGIPALVLAVSQIVGMMQRLESTD